MKIRHVTASLAPLALAIAPPATAQTMHQSKVDHATSCKNGVATSRTKVASTSKRKTSRANRGWA